MRLLNSLLNKLFRVSRTPEEVIELLNALLNKTITSEDWDYFISVKIVDPELEKIRDSVEGMWTHDSPYMLPGTMDPTDLNQKGIAEIKKMIASLQQT